MDDKKKPAAPAGGPRILRLSRICDHCGARCRRPQRYCRQCRRWLQVSEAVWRTKALLDAIREDSGP